MEMEMVHIKRERSCVCGLFVVVVMDIEKTSSRQLVFYPMNLDMYSKVLERLRANLFTLLTTYYLPATPKTTSLPSLGSALSEGNFLGS